MVVPEGERSGKANAPVGAVHARRHPPPENTRRVQPNATKKRVPPASHRPWWHPQYDKIGWQVRIVCSAELGSEELGITLHGKNRSGGGSGEVGWDRDARKHECAALVPCHGVPQARLHASASNNYSTLTQKWLKKNE